MWWLALIVNVTQQVALWKNLKALARSSTLWESAFFVWKDPLSSDPDKISGPSPFLFWSLPHCWNSSTLWLVSTALLTPEAASFRFWCGLSLFSGNSGLHLDGTAGGSHSTDWAAIGFWASPLVDYSDQQKANLISPLLIKKICIYDIQYGILKLYTCGIG